MPMIFTADGIQNNRSQDASGRIGSNDFIHSNETGFFEANISLNYKSFDLFIDSLVEPGAIHIIDISNNQIDLGDNIVVNVASNHPLVSANIYNITEEHCSLFIVNNDLSSMEIITEEILGEEGMGEEGGEVEGEGVEGEGLEISSSTEEIKLTITIIN